MLLFLSAVILSTLSPTTAIISKDLAGKKYYLFQWIRRGPPVSLRTETARFTKSESPEIVSVETERTVAMTGTGGGTRGTDTATGAGGIGPGPSVDTPGPVRDEGTVGDGFGGTSGPFKEGDLPPSIAPPPKVPSPPSVPPPPEVPSDIGLLPVPRESSRLIIEPPKEITPDPPTPPAEYTYTVIHPKRIRKGQNLDIFVEFRHPVLNERIHAVLTGRWQNKNETYAEVIQEVGGVDEQCKLPAVTGRCRAYFEKYHFNISSGRCEIFVYGGCGGNANNFEKIEDCQALCKGVKTAKISLPIPTGIDWRANQINITGYGDVNFRNNSDVNLAYKSKSIFVQTDRGMYKPGQTVKYRTFVTDSKLNPLDPQLDIDIYDPNGNKIQERKNLSSIFGVSGEFDLHEFPVLGNWRISVKMPDEDITKNINFEVAEYVLPKYEVTVELPPYGTKEDPELRGTIKANYTFGQPVKGFAKLTIYKRYGGGFYDPRSIVTEMPIDGTAEFVIPMEHILRLFRRLESEQTLRVHANVTESLTGDTLGGSSEMKFYPKPYKVEFFPNLSPNFKPRFPYTAVVKVTQQDGRPLVNPKEQLKITLTCFTNVDLELNNTTPQDIVFKSPFLLGETIAYDPEFYSIPENGIVTFPVDIHDKAATCNIKAEFGGEAVFKDISKFRAPSETYLKVDLLTPKPKVGEIATFQFNSSVPPGDVQYYIVSKGDIVGSGTVHVDVANQPYPFPVSMKKDYAPDARMVAFFTTTDGYIAADAVSFGLEDIFENKVLIGYDQEGSVVPGDNATLTIRAEPYSMVNVLVVDKSTKLQNAGNDITVDKVRDELNEYSGGYFPRGWGYSISYPANADDSCDVFKDSNLVLKTNADCASSNLWEQQRRPVPESVAFSGGMVAMDAAPMMRSATLKSHSGAAGMQQQEPRTRKDFPETWKWESATADENGSVVLTDTVPDTITEWHGSAYSISETKGLGVAPDPAKLVVFKDFFVNIDTPYSIIRGEQAVIQGNVYNYLPADLYTNVTLKGSNQFVSIVSDGAKEWEESGDQVRCVLVPANSATAVYFPIKPTDIGSVAVHLTARAGGKSDAVQKTIPVKPEGEPASFSIPVLLSLLKPGEVINETKNITYPADLIPGSTRLRIALFEDVFSPSIEGLDNLIRMPSGTGEQNMANFAPAAYASEYLQELGTLTEDLKKKTTNILLTGYQRELLFQRNDGSFSAWGNADKTGSLWLTAFVAKSFAKANNQIYINPNVVKRAVDFITQKQERDGSFVDEGSLHHYGLSGGSRNNNVSLAAYTVIALKEVQNAEILKDEETLRRLDLAIASAADYIKSNIPDMTTDYERAISAFAMKLTGNQQEAKLLLDKLDANTTAPDVCTLPEETGVGRAFFRRWFFNSQSGKCEQFTYGGVGGNGNNFETREACENECQDVCTLPEETGMGRAFFRRWFFNSQSGKCEQFTYGGAGGNGNNFETRAACENKCQVEKDGSCPPVPQGGICVEECQFDGDCNGKMKCCSNGCGHTCREPVAVDTSKASEFKGAGSTNLVFKDGKKHWKHESRPLEIEIASYALLAHVTPATRSEEPDIDSAMPILRWLVERRNPWGGFMSTQDTVIGMQGFSEMAKLLYTPNYNMTVHVTVDGKTIKFDLNKENSDVYQYVDFKGDVPTIGVYATGTGFGIVDIDVKYNVEKPPEPDTFKVDVGTIPDPSNVSISEIFDVVVCASYLPDRESGMVIMDVGAPSGYKLDKYKVVVTGPVKNVDSDNNRVNVYLEGLDNETVCVTIPAERTNIVAKVQPAFVKVYSVHNPDDFASRRYVPPGNERSLCELCGEKCDGCGTHKATPLDMCTPGPVPLLIRR